MTPFRQEVAEEHMGEWAFSRPRGNKATITVLDYSAEQGSGEAVGGWVYRPSWADSWTDGLG